MKRLLPKSLAGQTILVLLIGLTVSHILSMAIYSSERAEILMLSSDHQTIHHIADITRVLQETPSAWRERIVHVTNSRSLQVSVTPASRFVQAPSGDWRVRRLRQVLASLVNTVTEDEVVVQWLEGGMAPAGSETVPLTPGMHEHMAHAMTGTPPDHSIGVSIHLKDGQWVNFIATALPPGSIWSTQAVVSTVLMTLAVALFSLWVVRRMTRPLRAFATAAERLGRDVSAPPLPEDGPLEVTRAIRAFNDMQHRLRRLIENRTRMLAAISHDLKTPITLLRLRAEYITDDEEKQKALKILDEMEEMIRSTLAFAREDAAQEDRRVVDVSSLVGSLCDDMADAGRPVSFSAPPPIRYRCGPLALKRAVGNVVDNAVKYGGSAHVDVAEIADAVEIVVEDRGPGIPDGEIEDVFSPFYRIEPSRSPETGGVGLGLSVARTIVHLHGGEIALENRTGGGLRAVIRLPQ